MQVASRTQNARLNALWAILSQVIIAILGLICRKVFLDHLGAELLGVNGLFADVLLLFSFADLGFGVAIMFSMYKPIAENDNAKVQSLLLFYRSIYNYVIIVLLVISFAFVPFLKYLNTEIPTNELFVYYLLFQITNITEYLWAYRESYVIACQQERRLSIATLIYNSIRTILQIVSLIVFESFVVYLVLGVACLLLKKLIVNAYIKKDLSYYNPRECRTSTWARKKGGVT
jgi:membrane-associated HD superfamily phosphohydrolase